VASFTGDGAYDQNRVYASVAERHPTAAVVVPPRATAVPSDTAETAPTPRDGHLQHIAEHGAHGLAESIWIHETSPGRSHHEPVETGDRRWAARIRMSAG
jgi:hypothetical protein